MAINAKKPTLLKHIFFPSLSLGLCLLTGILSGSLTLYPCVSIRHFLYYSNPGNLNLPFSHRTSLISSPMITPTTNTHFSPPMCVPHIPSSHDHCGCFAWCIVVSTFLPFVLLFVPNNVCTMFCAANMLCCCHVFLPCCFATMLCFHVLLPCYVVLGLSLCSVMVSLLSWCVFCLIYNFLSQPPSPQEAFCLLVSHQCKWEFVLNRLDY